MKEKIAYYKRKIYERNSTMAIRHLSQIDHPEARAVLRSLLQASDVSRGVHCSAMVKLINVADKQSYPQIVQHFVDRYSSAAYLISVIHKIDDAQIVPALLTNFDNLTGLSYRSRHSVVEQTIKALAHIADDRALPALEDLLIRFPVDGDDSLNCKTPYGIMALQSLYHFDHPKATELINHWQPILDDYIQHHINKDTPFNETSTRIRIHRIMITMPAIINYLLDKLEHGSASERSAIIQEIGLKVFPLKRHPDLEEQIIAAFIKRVRDDEDDNVRLHAIKRLEYYHDDRVRRLALDIIDHPKLRTYALSILTRFADTSVADKVIAWTIDDAIPAKTLAYMHKYLAIIGTLDAEQAIVDCINNQNRRINVREAYFALAQLARHSDTAFEALYEFIETEQKITHRRLAIEALNRTGEKALGLLLSLLETQRETSVAAINALSSSEFYAAVPHLMELLLHNKKSATSRIIRTLQNIGTEPAFAAINAWEKSQKRL